MQMQQETPPPRPWIERPAARAVLAAVALAVLVAAVVMVRALRPGDNGSGPVSTAGAPASAGPPPSESGIGPLDSNAPLIGQPAPDFALRDTGGNAVKLSDLRGTVVWVNFWATWCVPCKKELPDIQKLYDEKHADGLEVLAVNWKDDPEAARQFFDSRGITLPLLLDRRGDVYDQYRLQGLPDSFFIDREGKIAALQFGFLTEEKMRQRLAAAGLP
jgi:peroxiredoxin